MAFSTSIQKKDTRNDFSNYRGIDVIGVVGILLEEQYRSDWKKMCKDK
jgi:hypothetical protein